MSLQYLNAGRRWYSLLWRLLVFLLLATGSFAVGYLTSPRT
jgi:hypothetical protein